MIMSTATKLLCLGPEDPIRLETRKTAMPRPGKGEVLVRVEATSVNPIDVKRARGYGQGNRIKRPAFQALEPDSVHRIRP